MLCNSLTITAKISAGVRFALQWIDDVVTWGVGVWVCEIIWKNSKLCDRITNSQYTNVADGRTDRVTDDIAHKQTTAISEMSEVDRALSIMLAFGSRVHDPISVYVFYVFTCSYLC